MPQDFDAKNAFPPYDVLHKASPSYVVPYSEQAENIILSRCMAARRSDAMLQVLLTLFHRLDGEEREALGWLIWSSSQGLPPHVRYGH